MVIDVPNTFVQDDVPQDGHQIIMVICVVLVDIPVEIAPEYIKILWQMMENKRFFM